VIREFSRRMRHFANIRSSHFPGGSLASVALRVTMVLQTGRDHPAVDLSSLGNPWAPPPVNATYDTVLSVTRESYGEHMFLHVPHYGPNAAAARLLVPDRGPARTVCAYIRRIEPRGSLRFDIKSVSTLACLSSLEASRSK